MATKKKVVPAAASTALPKGIATYGGRFYTNVYFGSYDTVEETVAIRERALEFKASLKDVAPKAVAAAAPEPEPVEAAPAAKKKKKAAAEKKAAAAAAVASAAN